MVVALMSEPEAADVLLGKHRIQPLGGGGSGGSSAAAARAPPMTRRGSTRGSQKSLMSEAEALQESAERILLTASDCPLIASGCF